MNTINYLAEMQCPTCKSRGPFKIAATTLFTVSRSGIEVFDDPEYDRGSYCECPKCGRGGIVEDFRIKSPVQDAGPSGEPGAIATQ
jgi:hypothetical protein